MIAKALKLLCSTKYVNVMRAENAVGSCGPPRISWCPYIPDTEDPHEIVHMLAVYFVRLMIIFY